MTRKEKELRIIDGFDLDIGDNIKIGEDIYKIVEDKDGVKIEDKGGHRFLIYLLISQDWKKVYQSLKDKKCKDIDYCAKCPLQNHYCGVFYEQGTGEHTLGEIYNEVKKDLDKAKKAIFGDKK